MATITAFEAKNHFGRLLDMVQSGEEVIITRRGTPVAKITSEEKGSAAERRTLMERILSSRAAMDRQGAARISARDLIDEGRRH